jgi:trimeric autotransporter adhesin
MKRLLPALLLLFACMPATHAQTNATVTTLSSVPTVLTAGSTITFTAAISAAAGSSTTNTFTGTVTFYDGTTSLDSPITVVNNEAVLSKITLDATISHVITAVYSGDTNWAGSTSNSLTFLVPTTGTGVTLQASSTVSLMGTLLTLTATVTESASATGTATTDVPTGSVTYFDGSTPIGSAAVSENAGVATATFYMRSLSAGTHTITAQYLGDSNFAASSSSAVTVTVDSYIVTPSTNSLSIQQGGTGSVVLTVAASQGLTGGVQFTCEPPANSFASCSLSPDQLSGNGTTTLTIDTSGAGAKTGLPLLVGGGGTLACFLLLCSPFGKRANKKLRGGVWLTLLLCAATAGMAGCGDHSSSGALSGTPTPTGALVFTVSSTSTLNGQTATQQTYITVNIVPAS